MKSSKKERDVNFYLSYLDKKFPETLKEVNEEINVSNINKNNSITTSFNLDVLDNRFDYESKQNFINSYIWDLKKVKQFQIVFLENDFSNTLNYNFFYLSKDNVNNYIQTYRNLYLKNDLESFFTFLMNKKKDTSINDFSNDLTKEYKNEIIKIYGKYLDIQNNSFTKKTQKKIFFYSGFYIFLTSIFFILILLIV